MTKMKRSTIIIVAIAVIAAIIIPIPFSKNKYFMDVFIQFATYVMMGVSMNLLLGFTGQISIGQAAFYGIGAYTSAILHTKLHVPFVLSLLAAVAVCFVFGLLLGAPSIKLNAIFLGLTTVGFNAIVELVMINEKWLTGGASGFTGIKTLTLFGQKMTKLQFYYMTLLLLFIILIITYRIVNSRTGRAFKAIRGSVIAASAMGINVKGYKLLVFAIAAAFTGVAGVVYAFNMKYINPSSFGNAMSIRILTMGIIGGLGSISGSVIGSLIVGLIPEVLRDYAEYQLAVYGVLVVVILRFMPGGFMGGIKHFMAFCQEKIKEKRAAKAVDTVKTPERRKEE